MNIDRETDRLVSYLSKILAIASQHLEERRLYPIAEKGWNERRLTEKQQSDFARVCWAAELFAAAEALREQHGCNFREFSGPAAVLHICAVNALDPKDRDNGPRTKALLKRALIDLQKSPSEADALADEFWQFRCSAAHSGLTERTDVRPFIIKGGTLIAANKGETMEDVIHHAEANQIPGTVNLVEELLFVDTVGFDLLRRAAATAIAKKIRSLSKGEMETRSICQKKPIYESSKPSPPC